MTFLPQELSCVSAQCKWESPRDTATCKMQLWILYVQFSYITTQNKWKSSRDTV